MSTALEKFNIASLFTFTEQTTLRIWFDLDQAGHDVDADRFLRAGLMVEHFQSRLSDVVAERSQEDLAKLAELEQAFQNEIDLAQGILAADKKNSGGTVTLTRDQYGVIKHFFGFS